ncbi:MAG: NAD(+) synthase, partial [Oscillospiraceae bacterium]
MQDGFLSVAVGTPKLRLGDCDYNAEQTFLLCRTAEKLGVKLLILPELGLTGATCGDLFDQPTLLDGAVEALTTVLKATRPLELVAAVGLPLRVGGGLYDCAAVLQRGKLLGIVPKSRLAVRSGLHQTRHFTPAPETTTTLSLCGQEGIPFGAGLRFACRELPDFVLGLELGEDLSAPNAPSLRMAADGATVIGNLCAGNDSVGTAAFRRQLVAAQSARLLCGYLCANPGEGESTSDLVFCGQNLIAENGVILQESRFETGLQVSEIDVARLAGERRRTQIFAGHTAQLAPIPFHLTVTATALTRYVAPAPFVPESREDRDARCEEILLIAALGLKQRLAHTGAKCAVVGLSGGLDSTLAMLITMIAMRLLDRPTSDVIAITMPCFGTTARTKTNAVLLAERLGATLKTVDISDTVRSHFRDIGHSFDDHSVTFENAQARERTQVLMDIANAEGGLVIGTGDLSELALGWATYNGDHMSMYGVNATIPKTLVRHLVAYVAHDNSGKDEELADVLEDILATPVSPELLPAIEGKISQKTEDLVGPYELHDFFLYHIVRWSCPPRKLLRLASRALGDKYDSATILKWMKTFYRRFFSQQFKRDCLPDGPKLGSVSFSPRGDWQMP